MKFLLFFHVIATGKFELLGILTVVHSRWRNIRIQAPHIKNLVRFRHFNIVQTFRSRGQHLCSKFAKISHLGYPRTFKVPTSFRGPPRSGIKLIAALCTSQIEASTYPPGQPPVHLNFWKIFVQIPPSRGRKAVQMPHFRSIAGDQMPPPPGNFSVAFIMFRKLCM